MSQSRKERPDGYVQHSRRSKGIRWLVVMLLAFVGAVFPIVERSQAQEAATQSLSSRDRLRNFDVRILLNANKLLDNGRDTFRFDTFGDEIFWGDTLQLHKAIEGAALGGVGPGVSPNTALNLGLKVDVDALPPSLISRLRRGRVNRMILLSRLLY